MLEKNDALKNISNKLWRQMNSLLKIFSRTKFAEVVHYGFDIHIHSRVIGNNLQNEQQ